MKIANDLRNWAKKQRTAGIIFTSLGDLRFQIYRPKLPDDEIQFNVRNLEDELPDIKFEEQLETKRFWVFALSKEGAATYEHAHEELKMSEPIEKLKKLFPDGRFDYVVDELLAYDGE